MDHPLPSAELSLRPWRTTALVASGLAALELVVLVVAGIALLGKPLTNHVRDAAIDREAAAAGVTLHKPKKEPVGAPKLTRAETSVIVLNGNGRSGAAGEEASLVRARGYVVGAVGNAQRSDYTRSMVMYRPGYRPEGVRLAHDLRIKIVGPLDGMRKKDLLGAHLALIIGS